MAAPATHIVLAELIVKKHYPESDWKQVVIGTSFPDIQYLGVISREKTHLEVNKLIEIKENEPFTLGLKIHSLVDIVREEYVRENGFYNLFPQSKFLSQSAKMFEDKILYKKLNNWVEIGNYFDEVTEGEKENGILDKDIFRWHKMLKQYLTAEPNTNSIQQFITDMGGAKEMVTEIARVTENVSNPKLAKSIIEDFYSKFESLIQ